MIIIIIIRETDRTTRLDGGGGGAGLQVDYKFVNTIRAAHKTVPIHRGPDFIIIIILLHAVCAPRTINPRALSAHYTVGTLLLCIFFFHLLSAARRVLHEFFGNSDSPSALVRYIVHGSARFGHEANNNSDNKFYTDGYARSFVALACPYTYRRTHNNITRVRTYILYTLYTRRVV